MAPADYYMLAVDNLTWVAIVALFVSHGWSFVEKYMGKSEHERLTPNQAMALPYRRMVITHTEVPEPIAGRGIAGELTRVALRFAREQKYKVVPACSYAEAFLQRHEEYHDLLVG